MSQTPPPGYTPPPADLPQRGDRATFSNRVDAWVTWFSTVILTQLAAIVANAYANALDAYASAASALGAKTAAETARDLAQGYRDAASTSATNAHDSEVNAAASALAAAGTQVTSTSTSSVLIGTGSKTFTTQVGKQFVVGVPAIAVDPTNPDNFISGPITAYSGTSLTINSTVVGGSGVTVASWNITIAGARGAQGPGNVTTPQRTITSADTVIAADNFKLLLLSGTFTLAATAAATLGAAFSFIAKNTSTTTLTTFDPAGAELVDGASLRVLQPGESRWFFCTGAGWITLQIDSGAGGFMHVRDQRASGVSGQSIPATTLTTVTLNTTLTNTIGGASLASNVVTLPPGTYEVKGAAPFSGSSPVAKIYIYSNTDSAYLLSGVSASGGSGVLEVYGRFSIAAAKDITMRAYSTSAITLGSPVSDGISETYTAFIMEKVA